MFSFCTGAGAAFVGCFDVEVRGFLACRNVGVFRHFDLATACAPDMLDVMLAGVLVDAYLAHSGELLGSRACSCCGCELCSSDDIPEFCAMHEVMLGS